MGPGVHGHVMVNGFSASATKLLMGRSYAIWRWVLRDLEQKGVRCRGFSSRLPSWWTRNTAILIGGQWLASTFSSESGPMHWKDHCIWGNKPCDIFWHDMKWRTGHLYNFRGAVRWALLANSDWATKGGQPPQPPSFALWPILWQTSWPHSHFPGTQVSPETPVWRHCLSYPQCAVYALVVRSRPSDGCSTYTVPVS